MDVHQLVNSLTSHIALYHRSSSNPNYSSTHRSAILRWFSSLTVDQRQAHLTTVDPNFVHLLIRMQDKLESHGHGFFLVLPDLPSSHCPSLPSFCFRKSQGLLARVSQCNDSERMVLESVGLFASNEGENVKDFRCSADGLDSMTVCEDFVVDVDRFVAVMDRVSHGEFLRGEESGLGMDWAEMNWLKARGYYSVEAFVANKLEISLRLAWINCIGCKRRGGKVKEKVGSSTVGVAVNVFRRKKGCVDWWGSLNKGTQVKVFSLILGRSAKSLVDEILKGANDDLGDGKQFFSIKDEQSLRSNSSRFSVNGYSVNAEDNVFVMPVAVSKKNNPFSNAFNRLLVLQEILSLFSSSRHGGFFKESFFSSLGSVRTISDRVLRKLRGLLMSVSLDLTQRELLGLLGEGKLSSTHNKLKGSVEAGKRRKKGRTRNIKKVNNAPSFHGGDLMHSSNFIGDQGCGLASVKSEACLKKHVPGETVSSVVKMEHANGLVGKQGKPSVRHGRMGITKNKSHNIIEKENVVTRASELPCSSIVSQGEACKSCHESGSSVQNITSDDSTGIVDSGLSFQNIHVSCNNNSNTFGSECHQANYSVIENGIISTGSELLSSLGTSKVSFGVNSVLESDIVSKESVSVNGFDKERTVSFNEHRDVNIFESRPRSFRECLPHEWPSIGNTATVQFPSSKTQHLPACTDGLHLDQNCHNHFHQAFVNTAIGGGCSQFLPQQMSANLDWPPMMKNIGGLAPPFTYTYDSGFVSGTQSSFWQGLAANNSQLNATANDVGKNYSTDHVDTPDFPSTPEIVDEYENHLLSEEHEMCGVHGVDYSQYFGGGVMYWNTSDHTGNSFSRPPSLSSDDNSSYACREADMNRAVDDMVAFSSSYSKTNGLTSPTSSPFCSSYDSLGPGHQTFGYVMPSNEVFSSLISDSMVDESTSGSLANISHDIDGKTCDLLPYPVLRPIIIPNFSSERSRSEFRHRSPCVPPSRRETTRIKRPPSPVVLCVPRAPHPPPSPANDSRNPRGFSMVRSGSSSPRNGGMSGLYQDGSNFGEVSVCIDDTEVVWPSWKNKILPARPVIQSLTGTLLQDRLMAISEHPDVAIPLRPVDLANDPTRKASLSLLHSLLHDEIDSFCKGVAAMNAFRKPYINWAVKRVTRSLQVLWPRSRSNIFGSNATGLSLPTSDVDLVVCLPPVRNLEPIKEAGILEGRNGIKETCLQHAARYLANQEWVKSDSLKTVENTAIPIIMLVIEVPQDFIAPSACNNSYTPKYAPTLITSEHEKHVHDEIVGLKNSVPPMFSKINCDHGNNLKAIRLDISFKSSSHTGLQTTELVRELTDRFPAVTPLASVLKMFLADRSLDQAYSGGLSSYCLVLLIIRFIQHDHHLGRPINHNYGSLLMDFLYFYGNIFDPRQMRISVLGSGVYIKRERGYSIDPIHIDDPLFPTNNVGRNCFRIHQCIKAFSDAFVVLENEVTRLCNEGDSIIRPQQKVLHKIIPSIDDFQGFQT